MIALDFPPAATSGCLRLLSFARHLPEHGWRTSVVTMRGNYYGTDSIVAGEAPPDCEVVRAFGFDTARTLAWHGRYPRWLAFPDRAMSWIADGIRCAVRTCRRRRVDAILSSSPSVSAHVIALVTKRLTGLPWVADLRDPWNLDVPHGRLSHWVDARLEHRALSAADRITVVAAGMIEHLRRRHGDDTAARARLVPNGFDEPSIELALAETREADRFRIVHSGACQPPYRDPMPLLRAVRRALDLGELPGDTLLELIGTELDDATHRLIADLRLQAHVCARSRVSHANALAASAHAALLLVIQNRREHGLCIPAKVYEYLSLGRPILALTPAGSETDAFLRRFAGVSVVAPGDIDSISAALVAAHRSWRAGDRTAAHRDVERYSRQQLAAQLAGIIDEVVPVAALTD